MSIETEINRISTNVSDTLSAISEMGGTVPENATSDDMASGVRSIPVGAKIDDSTSSPTTTYSSQKIDSEISKLNQANAAQNTEIAKKANDANLAKVAKSGSYSDLTGKPTIPTVPSSLPNPNALTFTGAVSETYDGSAPKSVAIPTVPSSIKNPYKLKLSGAVTAEYDGSTEVSVEIPEGGSSGYTLPIASPTTLGGVKAVAATDEMTDSVGITAEGLLKVKPGGESGFVVVADETVTLDGTGAALEFDIKTGVKSCVLYIDSEIDSVASSDKIQPTIDGHGVMGWFDQLNLSTAQYTGQTFYWPGVGSAPIVLGIRGGDPNGLGLAFKMVRGNINVCYCDWGGRTGKLRIEVPAKTGQMKIKCYAKY